MTFASLSAGLMRFFSYSAALLLIVLSLYLIFPNSGVALFDLLLLLTPYLVVVNFVLGFYNSIRRSKLLFFPLGALILWFIVSGPFIVFSSGDEERSPKDISILSYNVMEFIGNYRERPNDIQNRVLDFVKEQDADVVCFQEFSNTRTTREKLASYPYQFIYSRRGGKKYSPLSIFSRHPIISSGSLDFPNTFNNSIYVDLLVGKDTLRVYNVHLQSMRFRPGSIKRENPVQLLIRLGNTISRQKDQGAKILDHSRNSPFPVVFSGDFNNTQYSKVYGLLKKDKKDSFLEKGNGLGTTLLFKFLPFRIDFILVDDRLKITGHKNYNVFLSDHYPIMATFRFQNP